MKFLIGFVGFVAMLAALLVAGVPVTIVGAGLLWFGGFVAVVWGLTS